MKIASLLTALFGFLICIAPATAQASELSSSEDRQRLVAIVHNLERTPLDPGLRGERSWAIQWLTDAPDITVIVCADPIGGVSKDGYQHFPEIVVQYSLAMAAYIIENPSKVTDPAAQQLAGVESALQAYRVMVAAEPGKTSKQLDKLLALQARSELQDFVKKAFASCTAKGAK